MATEVLPLLCSRLMIEVDLPCVDRTDGGTFDLPPSIAAGHRRNACLLLTAEGVVLRHHADGTGFSAEITHAAVGYRNEENLQ